MKTMNLPNKLTVLRVLLVPIFVFFLLQADKHPAFQWIALVIFIAACLTDTADGQIARKYNLVTDFGKFMDPLADKLLVCSALVCLVELERLPAAIVIVILSREFIISGFRLVAAEKGRVIAAGMWGKIKTVFQMIMTILLIADIDALKGIAVFAMWAALALTIISLVDYLYKNRDILEDIV
jgi:CDP-diacylglycerol--glycerol-3-phosphate 3-phosphatidyltransferase